MLLKTTRVDGRVDDELRPVSIQPQFLQFAEGSALIEVGKTKVICAASIEDRVPPFLKGQGSGWVTAEYAMLPRATSERTPREAVAGRLSGRTHEIQRIIGRCLRSVVDMRVLGERTVTLDCDVLQADGGTRTAAITGAFVALVLALGRLHKEGRLRSWPLSDWLAATSVGLVDGRPLLDLCYEEDSRALVDFNVSMTGEGRFVDLQGTAEGAPFSKADMEKLLGLAARGIGALVEAQRSALVNFNLPAFGRRTVRS